MGNGDEFAEVIGQSKQLLYRGLVIRSVFRRSPTMAVGSR